MQLVAVANVGARLIANARDGLLIEPSDFVEHGLRQDASHLHGAGAALFQRSVIQIGVWIGVQDLVRELRGHRRVDRETADRAAVDSLDNCAQTVDVHRLGEHILHHLLDERVIGNL